MSDDGEYSHLCEIVRGSALSILTPIFWVQRRDTHCIDLQLPNLGAGESNDCTERDSYRTD